MTQVPLRPHNNAPLRTCIGGKWFLARLVISVVHRPGSVMRPSNRRSVALSADPISTVFSFWIPIR